MLIAHVCAGFIRCCYGVCGVKCFWGILGAPGSFVRVEGTGSAGQPFMCARLGLRRCAHRRTRPVGRGRWRHYLRGLLGLHWFAQKYVLQWEWMWFHRCDAVYACRSGTAHSPWLLCKVYWAKGTLRENCRQNLWETISASQHFAFEVLNVGSWLAHGDSALEARVDFLAVVEHRLLPARVRSKWARLKCKGLASIWAPACQDSSNVGNAVVGVVGLRGAPVAVAYLATAQFKKFFDCGRAIRCLQPLGGGRFMHLVVLYGYQGADSDAEQLATEQLFDAALCEPGVVARIQLCLIVGYFNVEPTKSPCLAKGIMAGLWVDLEESWAVAGRVQPAATCKRTWQSTGSHRRDFMVGCPLAAAAISSCWVERDRWIAPHLASRVHFDCVR